MPSGSQPWAGFANEDVSFYPLTFGEGGSITFTGSYRWCFSGCLL